ncbi:PRC and DUF2382 domain-containing protein [Streptomyces sp. NPDC046928]|uniref:PRC and DUF2382 domain-containing protein n=1 Tax=Streptomyces sp. NPDC046928 TaxID=3155021 RepID=UPI0033D4DA0E
MISREQIGNVLDRPVLGEGGKKIGEVKHVYVDDATGRPEWMSVKTGMFGSSESFVPIRDATVVEDHTEVPYSKGTVKDAPRVDADGGGHLSVDEEHQLYEYYGIDWDASWSRANQPGEGGWAHGGGTGAAGAAGTAEGGTTGAAGAAGAPGTADAAMRARGDRDDDAMTRSEERMHVGVERRESGRARLRKYVVTEEVERTVPVRHEEVRVEREPITDANRGAAMSGPDIAEAEHEVVLHEERPVTETEAVPVERVRLTAEERTEQETVHGTVRKERIEAEAEEIDDARQDQGPGHR